MQKDSLCEKKKSRKRRSKKTPEITENSLEVAVGLESDEYEDPDLEDL